jgi:hypothetical protein
MNYALRNIILIFVVFFSLAFGFYYLFSRQEGQYVPDTWAHIDCIHLVSVSNDDLQPTLQKGVILSLNQCIENKASLQREYIVKFEYDGRTRLGIIKDIEEDDREISYVISTSNFEEKQYTVPSQQIVAYTTIP